MMKQIFPRTMQVLATAGPLTGHPIRERLGAKTSLPAAEDSLAARTRGCWMAGSSRATVRKGTVVHARLCTAKVSLGWLALALLLAIPRAGAANAPATARAPVHTGAANAALGQHDSNAPINVASDNFVGNFQTKVGTYIGNVIVTQADYKLRADRVKVTVVNGKPTRFDATGHVVFVSSSGTATGDNGIYDLGPRTVTLTGHVVLTKEKDVMHGTMLTVNMVTGESHLTAHGENGNRVQGLFVQQQTPAGKGAATPPSGAPK
jgi:lipopolysaccharide export system protein LptA